MNLLRTAEFKVGILVLALSALVVYMTLSVSENPTYLGKAKKYWFVLDDASGIIKNSTIKTSGINVGVIKDISLVEGRARLDISIDPKVKIPVGSTIEIRAQGILGDRYVEIVIHDPQAEELESGSELKVTGNNGSMEAVMNKVSGLADSLNNIAETLKKAMTGDGDRSSPVGRIIGNLETLTGDVAEITNEKKGEIKDIVDNLDDVTSEIKDLINDPSDQGFKASFEKFNRGISRVDEITKNFDEVSDKLNSGKGTLGQLINDDKTADNLNQTITNVNEFLGTANKLESSIDFHTDYLTEGGAKTFVGLKLQPGLDRYYEVQLVDDPRGVIDTATTTTNGGTPQTYVTDYKDKLKFTAMFAKNFYNFTVKAGIIENTGGIGGEFHIIPGKFKVYFDAFDFASSQEKHAHLRAGLRYMLFHGIYFNGGYDDFANRAEATGYIGAGIDLNNDDIKYLISKVSL